MSSLTLSALRRPRFTLLLAFAIVLTGLWLALDFPSTEEPQITIRTATVFSAVPGASVERMEQLVARPTEESLRGLPEVKRLKTTVRPGFVFSYVELDPTVTAEKLPDVWRRLRTRMQDLRTNLPEGAIGPIVDDEFGRVAVLTMGLTGPGYHAGEIREQARRVRNELYKYPGVERVTLHGIQDEQIQIVLDVPALVAKGLSPMLVAQAVAKRNVFAPAGFVEVGGAQIALSVSGDVRNSEKLLTTPIPLPAGGSVPLAQVAKLERVSMDPPQVGAFVEGDTAAVIALSMKPGLNVVSFAEGLRTQVSRLESALPIGMKFVPITDQARIVTKQLSDVSRVFMETTVIVMGIVVLFLGWRSGLIVGAIVPTTVFGVLTFMRLLSIDLHIISVGAIIIALGLFVDNAIVVAEDMERRLGLGEPREAAAAEAGRTMFVPLLVSSLAIILTFMPLVLSSTDTGEYLSSLGIVMAIALLLSLLLAVTVTPLLCQRFAQQHHEKNAIARVVDAITDWYRGRVRWVLGHRSLFIGCMIALLGLAGWLLSQVPTELMPASERKQLQMSIELAPDSGVANTMKVAASISRALTDRKAFPEIASHAIYVGDGGPRFILALNPPTPASGRAYAVLTLDPTAPHAVAIDRLRKGLTEQFPDVRFEPKRFSMGASDSGLAVFRLSSSDGKSHLAAAERLLAALRSEQGMTEISTDAERQIQELDVQVDQARALAAGTSSADIAKSLDMLLGGMPIAQYRDGDTVLPVMLRGTPDLRGHIEQLVTLPVQKADGSGTVPLGQVARVQLRPQDAVIQRYNQERVVTISARHPALTAQGIADRVARVLAEIEAADQVKVALGGEIEENKDANGAIAQLLPACLIVMFLIFVWLFDSVRKSLIVLASIPFVSVGAAFALQLTGTTLTFVGTLGLLALAGIIVNNAVLLLGAIEEARSRGVPAAAAVEEAASKRLRPIVMTNLVCILGLVPLWLFGGVVWTSLAVVMIGGLAMGSIITLGLIPALYATAFRV